MSHPDPKPCIECGKLCEGFIMDMAGKGYAICREHSKQYRADGRIIELRDPYLDNIIYRLKTNK